MKKLITFVLMVFLISSCQKPQIPTNVGGETNIDNIVVSDNFDWKTTTDINVEMILQEDLMRSKIILPDGTLVYKGFPTDTSSRYLRTKITIPSDVEILNVSNGITETSVDVNGNTLYVDFNSVSTTKSTRVVCGDCDGQITKLKLEYVGNEPNPNIVVTQKKGGNHNYQIYNGTAVTVPFEFIGVNNHNKMGPKIKVYVNGVENVEMHTSCSVTFLAGMTFGDFLVVSGESDNGGALCDVSAPEEVDAYKGSLLFEDLYPSKGDYDFNDLVIQYNLQPYKTDQNKLDSLICTFKIKAFGASFRNGFGFQLPNIRTSKVKKVPGYVLKGNSIFTMKPKGTEENQVTSTFIVYDDSFDLMEHPGVGTGVNTESWIPFITPETIVLKIVFRDGKVDYDDLDIGNFNPFLIIDQNRGTEIHFVNNKPTNLFNYGLFTLYDDDSDPSIDRYFLTENNLPWVINVPRTNFMWMNERETITNGYLKFYEWAESEGNLYKNWYKDRPGYRDNTNIYVKQ